jgi:hypothetical protein
MTPRQRANACFCERKEVLISHFKEAIAAAYEASCQAIQAHPGFSDDEKRIAVEVIRARAKAG